MPTPATAGKSTLGGNIAAQLIAFLVCVVAPGALTAMAPVSWLTFQRQGDHVMARADTCLFFVIPYKKAVVDPVTEVSDEQITGSYSRKRRTGTDKYVKAEDEGFLFLKGPQGEGKISVSPHDLKDVRGKVEAFLKDPEAAELKLFVVANWKFGVIGGGLVSLLTVLYVVGVGCALVMLVLRAAGLAKPAAPQKRTGLP